MNPEIVKKPKYTQEEVFSMVESSINHTNMVYVDELKNKQRYIGNLRVEYDKLVRDNNRLRELLSRKKYVDAKQRYINLQKLNNAKSVSNINSRVDPYIGRVLIVMIGDMPTDPSVINHWKRFISEADEGLDIVVHPRDQTIRNRILSEWNIFFKKKESFMVCDTDHWVKTSWGNISLAFATLIAIEFAMKGKPYNYYKKIVFLQQCIPLYKYSIIRDELLRDNKSWFKPREGKYPGWEYSQPFAFNRSGNVGATIYDWNWWNAIFALDSSHYNIFFDPTHIDNNNNYTGTYKVDGTYTCYGNTYNNIVSISSNNKYKALFDQVMASWDWVNPSRSTSCINSDEVFFGVAFKNNFPGNDVTNNSRIIDFDAVEKLYTKNVFSNMNINLPYKFIYIFNDADKQLLQNHKNFAVNSRQPVFSELAKITNLDDNIYVYIPRVVWLTSELYKEKTNYPAYTGVATNYNPEHLKEYYVMRIKDIQHPRNTSDENSDEHSAKKLRATLLRDGKEVSYEYSDGLSDDDIRDNNIIRERIGKFTDNGTFVHKVKNNKTDPNQFTLKNIHDQPVTYHDWTSFTFNPANIFRDAHFSLDNSNGKCINGDLVYSNLKSPPEDLVNKIIDNKLKILPGKLPIWHPTEYYTDNLKNIINSYNIMSLCVICRDYVVSGDETVHFGGSGYTSHNGTHNYFNLTKIIKIIWRRSIMLFSNYVTEKFNKNNLSYFEINKNMASDDRVKLENVKIGTCITQDILSSALSVGALFIRKCITGSEFNQYSDCVFNIPEYIPHTKDNNTYGNKKHFGEFVYAPEKIFTWEFFREPRKKGLCELKLLSMKPDTFSNVAYDQKTDDLTIGGDKFMYKEVIGRGTNIAKLYVNDTGHGIVVKYGKTRGYLTGDIEAINKLKGKSFQSRFINAIVLNDQNILMEPFQGAISSLSADYIYNTALDIEEYIKILNFVATTLDMMNKNNPKLYYDDLKTENILYKCGDNNQYIVKFGDIGSIVDIPSRLGTYYAPDSVMTEKSIVWTFGIFLIQLMGGVWVSGKLYRKLIKQNMEKFKKYIDSLISHSMLSIKTFYNLDDSHGIFNIIRSTLDLNPDNRFSILQLATAVNSL